MIHDATDDSHPFDVILVWKHSRSPETAQPRGRLCKISITYKSLLAEHAVRVISIS